MTREESHVIRTIPTAALHPRPRGVEMGMQEVPLTNSIRPKVMPSNIGYDFFA